MNRILLYVHFNKYNKISAHVYYQLEQMRSLFSKIVFISNSKVSHEDLKRLKNHCLIDEFLQRKNKGFDFSAWHDGLITMGFDKLEEFDSLTIMNDTCFGPIWEMGPYFENFEEKEAVDFWGITNNRGTKAFKEHVQSYFMTFKNQVIQNKVFQQFWQSIIEYENVQEVIQHYETQLTSILLNEGFSYQTVFDTRKAESSFMLHPDFSYYNPTAILKHHVPFIKVKAIDANQHIAPYLLNLIRETTNYPIDLIVSHMSQISLPDAKYLLSQKYLNCQRLAKQTCQKVAVHLHVFYVDLLDEFLTAFEDWNFHYDLFITTDSDIKRKEIKEILQRKGKTADIRVTGNRGRDIYPMLLLKDKLSQYDYIGHFHTKKSKEADFWAGESWRKELIDMLVKPADSILSAFETDDIGIIIADIPSFFRFNKIVNAWNEHLIAQEMMSLWRKMDVKKQIDFQAMDTFVMSYGTFVWFKYDALKSLFDLELTQNDIPSEPLPQNSILHAIERLLVYIAWGNSYDFRIVKNPYELTPFIDNKLLNLREDEGAHTYVNFNQMGGIKGALKYIIVGPAKAMKYIFLRLMEKLK
ncbi:TPA: alpha-L-Rha alpha-1,3-L-rhamnosyltransferase [Streptococcus pyogenes]|uniref:rhamnan synthesis F family protein n=1 Tax=Streptococcus pyogenes TaxID=1314 RepID=UPI0010A1557C|nr:rhamnan synthesis F family protein [Streptococcus pyogenes]VGQ37840.1 rhamnosyltransferase [Streptococcus pyogenes]VGV68999.1 rhamnosyltransferase [Streptococcus pyogenes]VGV84316.1 rhamnosyltransferase [Streptococcus pyogenes]VHB17246.1 rhamnosyltransferase [Streptococcus pyogenes]VHB23964.1 rhamnosyltransferase [Streptococcus pyogenes]